VSIFPLIVSPSTFPVYLVVNVCPCLSRTTLKEISPSLKVASSILVSLLRPTMAPVSLSPSSFSLSVAERVLPPASNDHFQVPVGLALSSARATHNGAANTTTNAATTKRLITSPRNEHQGVRPARLRTSGFALVILGKRRASFARALQEILGVWG